MIFVRTQEQHAGVQCGSGISGGPIVMALNVRAHHMLAVWESADRCTKSETATRISGSNDIIGSPKMASVGTRALSLSKICMVTLRGHLFYQTSVKHMMFLLHPLRKEYSRCHLFSVRLLLQYCGLYDVLFFWGRWADEGRGRICLIIMDGEIAIHQLTLSYIRS